MKRRIPNPGILLGVIACVLALTGGAYAAGGVTKKQVTKIAKKQAKKQIKKQAPKLEVKSAKTAETAQNALNAVNAAAVGGLVGHKLAATTPTDGEATTVLEAKGLKLTLECPGGFTKVDATTTVDDSVIATFDAGNNTDDPDFDTGETVQVDGGYATVLSYTNPNGDVVTATYTADMQGGQCYVRGTAFSG